MMYLFINYHDNKYSYFSVELRVKEMKSYYEHLKSEVEKLYQFEMMKLPKAIQSMKMKDFLGNYDFCVPCPDYFTLHVGLKVENCSCPRLNTSKLVFT